MRALLLSAYHLDLRAGRQRPSDAAGAVGEQRHFSAESCIEPGTCFLERRLTLPCYRDSGQQRTHADNRRWLGTGLGGRVQRAGCPARPHKVLLIVTRNSPASELK
jgi:hypothetical protein